MSSIDDRAIQQALMGEYALDMTHPLKRETLGLEILFRGLPAKCFHISGAISAIMSSNHVSVGSGCAGIETLVFKEKKIICVDPDPTMGCEAYPIFHPPEFKYTKDLVENQPSLIGNCSLWLLWPNPACPFCKFGMCMAEKLHHQEYDFEAIELLKPRVITMLVSLEENISGSRKLSEWVKNTAKSNYQIVFTCNSMAVTAYDMKLHPLITKTQYFCLVRKDKYTPALVAPFKQLRIPSTFYTLEDYWLIRNSMKPEDLAFDKSFEEVLKKYTTAAAFKPLKEIMTKEIISSQKSISSKPPSIINSLQKKEDRGFAFVFE
jgi:hypothetical protein